MPVACTFEQVQKLDLSCSVDDPCPLYLELADVETVGIGSCLPVMSTHPPRRSNPYCWSAMMEGRLGLKLTRVIPGGALTDIQFLDFEAGWISGHILHPDARDPFFLISSDGGKTWRRRPVYSEPKTGAIEQFRFTSKTRANDGRSGTSR